MAYNFKNLADVELLDTMPENAKVIVEVDGATKRAPKEDGIGKLVSVEALEEVPEGANVLVEINGEIKRVPGSGLKSSGFACIEATLDKGFTCNMTLEQLVSHIQAGGQIVIHLTDEDSRGGTLYIPAKKWEYIDEHNTVLIWVEDEASGISIWIRYDEEGLGIHEE